MACSYYKSSSRVGLQREDLTGSTKEEAALFACLGETETGGGEGGGSGRGGVRRAHTSA